MVDIATLGIEVRSESLLRASANLDKFAGTTQRVEQRLQGFSTGMAKVQGTVNQLSQSMQSAGRVMNGFSNILQLLGVSLAIKEVGGLADTWSDLNSRVRIAAGGIEQGTEAMARLAEMARRTYSSLEDTTETYIRNATAMRELGYSTDQTLDYVESINNALVVSGAKGERAASVMNALSNAMALGKLSGQNLDTVLASGGRVAEALANSMGTTVNQLKQLGAQGKITSSDIYGITKELDKLRKEADSMPATIGDAFVLMRNSVMQYIGVLDESNRVSEGFAEKIIYLADHIEVIGGAMLTVGGIAGARFLGPMISSMSKATASTTAMTAAILKGNAVMLDSRTAALQKANYIKQAALADQQAAKASLDVANAERVRAVAALEAAKAGQLAGVTHAQAAAQLVLANKAVSASQVDLAAKTVIADRALISQDIAMTRASKTARVMGAAMTLGRGALSLVGGPVGASILALGTAMYFSSQKAEEARQKSEELQRVWKDLGYDAPQTAENIDKISEALVRMSDGEKIQKIRDIKDEIERLTNTRVKSFGDIFSSGGDDAFKNMLNNARKASENSDADKKAFVHLESYLDLVRRFPTEAYRMRDSIAALKNQNLSDDMIVYLDQVLKTMDLVQQGLNENMMIGGKLGIEKARAEFEALSNQVDVLTAKAYGLSEEKANQVKELIKNFENSGKSVQQLRDEIEDVISNEKKFQPFIHRVTEIADSFLFANDKAKEFQKIIDDLNGKIINIAIQLTTIGGIPDIVKEANSIQKGIDDNYQKMMKDASRTAKEKRIDEIKKGLIGPTNNNTIEYNSPSINQQAEDIYKVEEAAKKSTKNTSDAYRDLMKSGDDRIEQIKLEAQAAGLNGIAADTMRMKLELLQKAQSKGGKVSEVQRQEIEKLTQSYQKASEEAAKAAIKADLYNEQMMMGLSTIEQAVASRMQNQGLIYGSDPQMEAAIRYNEQLKIGAGLANSFFSTFINDMVNGTNATNALGNALKGIGNQLIDMAINNMVSNALGPLLGGGGRSSGNGLLGSIVGGLFGGGGFQSNQLAGALASGATGLYAQGGAFAQNAQMFANGGSFTNSIYNSPTPFMFANGGGFSPGIMGEAGPEAVMPLKRDASGSLGIGIADWVSGKTGSGSGSGSAQGVKVDVGVSIDETGALKAYIKNVSQETTIEGIKEYDRQLPDTIGQKIGMAQRKNRLGAS